MAEHTFGIEAGMTGHSRLYQTEVEWVKSYLLIYGVPFAAFTPAVYWGLMLLGRLPHGLPIIVAPALIDVIIMLLGNAALPEREPSAPFHFFQRERHLGKMTLRPVAVPP